MDKRLEHDEGNMGCVVYKMPPAFGASPSEIAIGSTWTANSYAKLAETSHVRGSLVPRPAGPLDDEGPASP